MKKKRKDPKPGEKTSICLSPAFLKPVEEKDHYGLFRYVVIKHSDGDENIEPPLGPLMIYRKCAKDEQEDMWTFDEILKERVGLKKVWDARESQQ